MMSASKKILVALDFDETIINKNSDTYIRKLAPGGVIPQEIQDSYANKCWTDFMSATFKYIHECGVKPVDIHNCLTEIPFVDGMKELFCDHFSQKQYEIIIISDSNSVFIDTILKEAKLDGFVRNVYTNPAEYDTSGCLSIRYYHEQDWCRLSTKNMCKGHILQTHIADRMKAGVTFDLVAYIGDGGNDLCPSLTLRPDDITCPRKGYTLFKKIQEGVENLKAIAKPWDTGFELAEIFSLIQNEQRD